MWEFVVFEFCCGVWWLGLVVLFVVCLSCACLLGCFDVGGGFVLALDFGYRLLLVGFVIALSARLLSGFVLCVDGWFRLFHCGLVVCYLVAFVLGLLC